MLLSLFLAVAGAAATTFVLGLFKGPSIDDQLGKVRESAARAGWTVRSFTHVQLRQAARGYLFVLSPNDTTSQSDQIRLYEAHGNDLRLAFQYQPRLRRLGRSPTRYTNDSVSFSILGTSDTDGDGQNELLGTYDYVVVGGRLRLPISVVWSDRRQAYVVNPLLTRPPSVPTDAIPASVRSQYQNGLLLQRIGDRSAFKAYGTDELVVQRWQGGPREIPVLIGGIRTIEPTSARSRLLVVGWAYRFDRGRPQMSPLCYTTKSAVLRVLAPTGDLPAALRSGWDAISRADRAAAAGLPEGKTLGTNITGDCIMGE